jgi:metal-dependent hydrolase (beta-lactamase superfamily II)
VDNALTLGKDLKSIGKVFLSHGHSDHTGGLPMRPSRSLTFPRLACPTAPGFGPHRGFTRFLEIDFDMVMWGQSLRFDGGI